MAEAVQKSRCQHCRSDILVPDSYHHGDHVKCGSCGMRHKVSRGDVLRLVLGHGLRLMFTGVALGLVLSFALTRFLSSLLLGVTSTDAVTFSGVAILLCAVALFACFIPARRAMRLDPMRALRHE